MSKSGGNACRSRPATPRSPRRCSGCTPIPTTCAPPIPAGSRATWSSPISTPSIPTRTRWRRSRRITAAADWATPPSSSASPASCATSSGRSASAAPRSPATPTGCGRAAHRHRAGPPPHRRDPRRGAGRPRPLPALTLLLRGCKPALAPPRISNRPRRVHLGSHDTDPAIRPRHVRGCHRPRRRAPVPRPVLRDVVRKECLADEVGLDFFGVGEHHREDFAVSSPEMVLAAIAARTTRIRLGSAVTVLSSDDPVRSTSASRPCRPSRTAAPR